MKNIKSFSIFEYAPNNIAAISGGNYKHTPRSEEEASSKEDEFLILCKNPGALLGKGNLLNGKLVDVTVKKEEPKKGFIKKLFGADSQILFTFDCGMEKKKETQVLMEFDGTKFKQVKSEKDGYETIQGYMDAEQAKKFLSWLFKSKFAEELKKNFPDIEKLLTVEELSRLIKKFEDD